MNGRGLWMPRSGAGLAARVVTNLSFLLAFAAPAAAQESQSKYVTQAANRLTSLIDQANKDGFKLSNNKLSIGGGWLKQGSEWVALFPVVLEKGKAYRLLAAGDDDAMDVDLQIVDANGATLKEDTKNDPQAIVDFTPPTTQQYQVRVRVFASRENVPCVCLGIVLAKSE
jgi:hypothetical protein